MKNFKNKIINKMKWKKGKFLMQKSLFFVFVPCKILQFIIYSEGIIIRDD